MRCVWGERGRDVLFVQACLGRPMKQKEICKWGGVKQSGMLNALFSPCFLLVLFSLPPLAPPFPRKRLWQKLHWILGIVSAFRAFRFLAIGVLIYV